MPLVLCAEIQSIVPLDLKAIPIMQITFNFDAKKTLQVVAFFLKHNSAGIDKAKLMKLVYRADRASFIERGFPITGDAPYAMKLGPVPTDTLHLIDGEFYPIFGKIYDHISLMNVRVNLVKDPGEDLLSEEEKAFLESVWKAHGHKPTLKVCYETHDLPEYRETFVEGTSTRIPYELIAQHSGNPERYRKGRPVISPEMAQAMRSPFPPERDLVRQSQA